MALPAAGAEVAFRRYARTCHAYEVEAVRTVTLNGSGARPALSACASFSRSFTKSCVLRCTSRGPRWGRSELKESRQSNPFVLVYDLLC